MKEPKRLAHSELLQLKRWNTPTIYNGWEQITAGNPARDAFNLEETRDFMPQMGPMVGYAVTCVIQPGNPEHAKNNPDAWSQYRKYLAGEVYPKIVVVQDLDKPDTFGAGWGEVNSNIHRALGCVGAIIDGAIRDVDEMCNAGFKALARRFAVGHGHAVPVRWGCEVEVFGRLIRHGQLVHADKHGFLAVPEGEEEGLLEAARFMDANECDHLIRAARNVAGKSLDQIREEIDAGAASFGSAARDRFGRKGEW
jgi:4-hydroxy-4-methyl-2-oxoglutarate aldolase